MDTHLCGPGFSPSITPARAATMKGAAKVMTVSSAICRYFKPVNWHMVVRASRTERVICRPGRRVRISFRPSTGPKKTIMTTKCTIYRAQAA